MIPVNGSPWWESFRKLSPLATSTKNVKQGVENGFPLPFLSVRVASFEEQADQDFSFSFAKIAWVGFQREQPARCCLVGKNRGRRSLPTFS